MTLRFPIVLNQGETFTLSFPVVDATGTAPPVTGWSARGQIRRTPGEPVLYEWVSSAGNIDVVYTPAVGSVPAKATVTLHVPAATSSAWTWVSAAYDLELTDTSGNTSRLAEGSVRVSPEITH